MIQFCSYPLLLQSAAIKYNVTYSEQSSKLEKYKTAHEEYVNLLMVYLQAPLFTYLSTVVNWLISYCQKSKNRKGVQTIHKNAT